MLESQFLCPSPRAPLRVMGTSWYMSVSNAIIDPFETGCESDSKRVNGKKVIAVEL